MKDEMITVPEIAKYLRISPPTVYKLVNSGAIPHVKVGFRYIIPRTKFLIWLDEHTSGGIAHE